MIQERIQVKHFPMIKKQIIYNILTTRKEHMYRSDVRVMPQCCVLAKHIKNIGHLPDYDGVEIEDLNIYL